MRDPSAETRRKIERDINAILRKAQIAENQGVREFLKVVNELRERIIIELADRGQLSSHLVREIRQAVYDITETYRIRFEDVLSENQRRMFVKGIQVIDTALDSVDIFKSVPYLSETVLQNAQIYGAELITGLVEYTRSEINKKLMLGLMGQKSMTDVIKEIAGKLPGPSVFGTIKARALIVARTEANRVLSLSSTERMKQIGDTVTDLMKFWRHSHLGEVRINHLAMEAVGMIPYDQKFKLLGKDGILYEVDGPYDPVLPASETINCRCNVICVLKRYLKAA